MELKIFKIKVKRKRPHYEDLKDAPHAGSKEIIRYLKETQGDLAYGEIVRNAVFIPMKDSVTNHV